MKDSSSKMNRFLASFQKNLVENTPFFIDSTCALMTFIAVYFCICFLLAHLIGFLFSRFLFTAYYCLHFSAVVAVGSFVSWVIRPAISRFSLMTRARLWDYFQFNRYFTGYEGSFVWRGYLITRSNRRILVNGIDVTERWERFGSVSRDLSTKTSIYDFSLYNFYIHVNYDSKTKVWSEHDSWIDLIAHTAFSLCFCLVAWVALPASYAMGSVSLLCIISDVPGFWLGYTTYSCFQAESFFVSFPTSLRLAWLNYKGKVDDQAWTHSYLTTKGQLRHTPKGLYLDGKHCGWTLDISESPILGELDHDSSRLDGRCNRFAFEHQLRCAGILPKGGFLDQDQTLEFYDRTLFYLSILACLTFITLHPMTIAHFTSLYSYWPIPGNRYLFLMVTKIIPTIALFFGFRVASQLLGAWVWDWTQARSHRKEALHCEADHATEQKTFHTPVGDILFSEGKFMFQGQCHSELKIPAGIHISSHFSWIKRLTQSILSRLKHLESVIQISTPPPTVFPSDLKDTVRRARDIAVGVAYTCASPVWHILQHAVLPLYFLNDNIVLKPTMSAHDIQLTLDQRFAKRSLYGAIATVALFAAFLCSPWATSLAAYLWVDLIVTKAVSFGLMILVTSLFLVFLGSVIYTGYQLKELIFNEAYQIYDYFFYPTHSVAPAVAPKTQRGRERGLAESIGFIREMVNLSVTDFYTTHSSALDDMAKILATHHDQAVKDRTGAHSDSLVQLLDLGRAYLKSMTTFHHDVCCNEHSARSSWLFSSPEKNSARIQVQKTKLNNIRSSLSSQIKTISMGLMQLPR